MSKTKSKLGRNPLEKMAQPKRRTLPSLDLPGPELPFIEKVRELQIQVNWEELYKATVEKKIKQISRFFLRF